MYRKTFITVNKKLLKSNIVSILKKYDDYKYYFGVVKGNCYGHGIELITTMKEAGINYFAVSSLDEAIEVRKIDKITPVLIFGYVSQTDCLVAKQNNLTVSIISYEQYLEIKDVKVKCHIKLNTGMNRVGIDNKEHVKEIVENMNVEGIYTHFGTDGVMDVYHDLQYNSFLELTSLIDLEKIKIVHLYNSLNLVRREKRNIANGVRLGLIMYGYTNSIKEPSGIRKTKFNIRKKLKTKFSKVSKTTLENNLKLDKILKLESQIIYLKKINKQSFVGYNASFIAKTPCFVATLPIGTADGINKNYNQVYINGKYYKIINYNMDYTNILVDETIKLYDKAEIIGDNISINAIAKNNNISVHQVLVSLTDRIKRIIE